MKFLTASQWLVLDNLKHNWPYKTNLNPSFAGDAYLWCVNQEFVKDGMITPAGELALMNSPVVVTQDAYARVAVED